MNDHPAAEALREWQKKQDAVGLVSGAVNRIAANTNCAWCALDLLRQHGPAMLAALEDQRWCDMDSAPKDRPILVACGDGSAEIVIWDAGWFDNGRLVRPAGWLIYANGQLIQEECELNFMGLYLEPIKWRSIPKSDTMKEVAGELVERPIKWDYCDFAGPPPDGFSCWRDWIIGGVYLHVTVCRKPEFAELCRLAEIGRRAEGAQRYPLVRNIEGNMGSFIRASDVLDVPGEGS